MSAPRLDEMREHFTLLQQQLLLQMAMVVHQVLLLQLLLQVVQAPEQILMRKLLLLTLSPPLSPSPSFSPSPLPATFNYSTPAPPYLLLSCAAWVR